MVLKKAVTLLESFWVWQLDKCHHIWEDKVLMNNFKDVLQTTLIKTNLHTKIINKSKMESKMAVTRLKYFLRQSLKLEKKLTYSYHVREEGVLMKGNQRDITNNLFRNLICSRVVA